MLIKNTPQGVFFMSKELHAGVTIIPIFKAPEFLGAVIDLGDINKKTLGFLPKAAFNQYALDGQILLAIQDKKLTGYLMYRPVNMKITIVHLCVDGQFRGIGIARKLFNYLKESSKNYIGIGLFCRRDYVATKIWPQLGFVARHEKVGRSIAGHKLTYWWHDNGHPNLFTIINDGDKRQRVVFDANIFFDLMSNDDASQESKYLDDAYLNEVYQFCLTDEINNEINRNSDEFIRNKSRSNINNFEILRGIFGDIEKLSREVQATLGPFVKCKNNSDYLHLAYSIYNNVKMFITRDSDLLKNSDLVDDKFDIRIMRPLDLILIQDKQLNPSQYNPSRLYGSHFELKKVSQYDENEFKKLYLMNKDGEKVSDFLKNIRIRLADSKKSIVYEIISSDDRIGLCSLHFDEQCLHVEILRITVKNKLKFTVSRRLIETILNIAIERRIYIVVCSDKFLSDELYGALVASNFVSIKNIFIKVNAYINGSIEDLRKFLCDLSLQYKEFNIELCELSKALDINTDQNYLVKTEKIFFPAKIKTDSIPCYIIPIKPAWARFLLDPTISPVSLINTFDEILLRTENVYYRANQGKILFPSRVLWYISYDKDSPRSKFIGSSSYIKDIKVGEAKKIFREFERYGIYKWDNIYELAKYDARTNIMAIIFEKTELFSRHVSLNDIMKIINRNENKNPVMQSPFRISSDSFFEIHNKGFIR